MEIRYLKLVFVLSLQLWSLCSFIGNFLAFQGTYNSVERTLSMSELPPIVKRTFATSSPLLCWLGVALIIIGKGIAAICLAVGFWQMWDAVAAPSEIFNHAKTWALIGGWVNVLWLFLGFSFVGEIIYYMFASPRGAAEAQTAVRCTVYNALIMFFVAMPD